MWRWRLAAIGLVLLASVGCSNGTGGGSSGDASNNFGYPIGEIKFQDEAPANTTVAESITSLMFTRPAGGEVSLQDFVKEKTVVLVITRGNTTPICPYCSTQTARLIGAYDDFVQRGVEIVGDHAAVEEAVVRQQRRRPAHADLAAAERAQRV